MEQKRRLTAHDLLKIRIAYLAMWLQDIYISVADTLHRFWVIFLVFACQLIANYNGSDARVLYAATHGDNQDITPMIQCYYLTDHILSVASMDRWLQKFNYGPLGCVTIVFVRDGVIRTSLIDLIEDREHKTGSECCDTGLDTIPSIILATCGDMHT